MTYYRKDNNDIDKFIIDTINNINSEIESLDKRISNLDNGNNVVNNTQGNKIFKETKIYYLYPKFTNIKLKNI